MPIQADSSKPVRTMDTNGKLVSTDTNSANAVKTVDTQGRMFETFDTSKLENKSEAEVVKSEEKSSTSEQKINDPEAEARKLYLEAQKAERRAKEMEKKAKAGLSKADAIEKAIAMTKNGGDPTAILTASNIDPIQFYKDMTAHVLKTPNKPEDPIQKQLRETNEKLDQYAKANEVLVRTQKEERELKEHNDIISQHVIPLLQKNPERYEALLTEYGSNTAVEVYKAIWQRYQETGEYVPFEQAADRMEEYWTNQIESGINVASKLKKFSKRFAQSVENSRETKTVAETETPKSNTFTLSNQQKVVSPQNKLPGNLTWEERVEAIKRKHSI